MKIGVLGGGQLARMMAEVAGKLNLQLCCFEPEKNTSASFVTDIFHANYTKENIQQFAKTVEVLTYENENIDPTLLQNITTPIYPAIDALAISQDRLIEKNFFKTLNIPTVKFTQTLKDVRLPAILKTRRLGYDGKGQHWLRTESDLPAVNIADYILEEAISFDTECSQIAVRNQSGDILFYPLTENKHEQGILRISRVPFNNEKLAVLAQQYTRLVMEKLNYVGVLAIEFFVVGETLIVNEMAPRVHNSGHWTIEGAQTSQFENHLRAIAGLPLGAVDLIAPCEMHNIIGEWPKVLPQGIIHDYQKTPRAGRKLGHVTICL